MPAITVPAPGKPRGPCKGWCRHINCKDMKSWARSTCVYCKQKIGFGVPLYLHGEYTAHASCHDDAVLENAALFTLP